MANSSVLNLASLPQYPVPPSPSSSSLCSILTPASATTNKHKILLTMGPCTWQSENRIIQCTCPSGSSISSFDELTAQAECDTCSHPMSLHLGYRSPVSPDSSHPPAHIVEPVGIGHHAVSRNRLVDELIARVKHFHIVRVNGTPASGKTILLNLMANKILAYDPSTPVYTISGWKEDAVRSANGWAAYLEHKTGIHGRRWVTHCGYLLIDEAQQYYWDDELWADLFKAIEPTSQAYIVLFASYGSPTRGFTGFDPEKNVITPMIFGANQQISLRPDINARWPWKPVGLLLDEDEANEVVERYAPTFIPNCRPILTQDLKQGLFLTSNGHVGLITSLINFLSSVPSTTSKALFSDPKEFFKSLQNLPFARGLPPSRIVQQPGPASILKKAIVCDGIHESSFGYKGTDSKKDLEFIWANGWLHAEKSDDDIHFVFASQIHRWYCQCLFSEGHLDTELDYDSPLQLALVAIRRFQPRQLSDVPRSLTGNTPPLEDQYQKEFHRCLFPLLDGHVIMSPEYVIKAGTNGGIIDFLVAQKKWGLELLRDRDRISQHMARFEPGGQYFTMIQSGKMEQYVVLDFTDKFPQKSRPEFRGYLYHVVFSENYGKVKVTDGSDLSEVDSFVLMQNANPIE
ncbi:hypothetical protein BDW72DRAFT_212891 [Aspergillus terricola var. indicus]